MRVESDRQGHHSSEAPACHRCGIPLLADTTFCPYCERWLDDGAQKPPRLAFLNRDALLTERGLLTAGFVFFGLVAAACIIAAIIL